MLLLSGCATDNVDPPKPSASPPAPLFESEEDAVAAAEAALTEYWRVSGEVFRAGGEEVERLEPLVTEGRFDDLLLTRDEFTKRGWLQIGEITVDSTRFQSTYRKDGINYLAVTTCTDYSLYSVETTDGRWVELVEPRVRVPYEAIFEVPSGDVSHLLLSGYEKWPETC